MKTCHTFVFNLFELRTDAGTFATSRTLTKQVRVDAANEKDAWEYARMLCLYGNPNRELLLVGRLVDAEAAK